MAAPAFAASGVSGVRQDSTEREQLARCYREVRRATESLCESLAAEDYVVQAIPEASPAKWHLAHTTWFFEHFVLLPFHSRYRVFHREFGYLFNSYYERVGAFYPRAQRGQLSRPTAEEIYRYRAYVDERLVELVLEPGLSIEATARIELGLHHEAQHQELLLTDIKALFAMNPLRPAFKVSERPPAARQCSATEEWLMAPRGVHEIGHSGNGFCFDNERPRHPAFLAGARLAGQAVTNGDFMAFISEDGYRRAELWLSDAWKTAKERAWSAPLYWEQIDGQWWHYTLRGMTPVAPEEPVCHVSFYEADAYARWCGARLPTEAEWEVAVAGAPVQGNFLESGALHPQPQQRCCRFGDVWVWTQSAYAPYPGYRSAADALGEYNGKFMVNQLVLRGGSCLSPRSHIRPTYRNFFYAADRWQCTGLRLARDA